MASNPFDSAGAVSTNPFDKAGNGPTNPFSAFGDTAKGVGSKVLDLMGRTGDAGMAFASTPGDWNPKNIVPEFAQAGQNAANAFRHGTSPATRQTQRDKVKGDFGLTGLSNALPSGLPRGTLDTLVDAAVDPATAIGGGGLAERGANALGRRVFVGAARGANAVPGAVGHGVQGALDFIQPGGSKLGALKRNLAANEGVKGLDKYSLIRSAAKGATNAGTSTKDAVTKALFDEGMIPAKDAPIPKPPASTIPKAAVTNAVKAATAATKAKAKTAAPLGVGPGFFGKPKVADITQGLEQQRTAQERVAQALGVGEGFIPKKPVPEIPPAVGDLPPDIAAALKQNPDIISKFGQTPLGKVTKGAAKGTTSAMFAMPQLPGLPGHGSNIAELAGFSDPVQALVGTARFFGSGEALPFSKMRAAAQNIPAVGGLKAAQDAAIARAEHTGAATVKPEDFGKPGWLDKIPGVANMARESNRSLQAYDDAIKGALNDHWTKVYARQGFSPAMAAAKASERVGQDIVDYSDKSDLNRALQHALPFATFATKKPGLVARAAVRHPERVLALTRNNPNFSSDRSEPMSDPDQGRPLASIFNALNNKSPSAKGGAPFPGAQYIRASAGAPANDLAGLLNAYFTYGPPAKHGDGNGLAGWAKLLLSQTLGNVPGGDQALNATGLNYFGK